MHISSRKLIHRELLILLLYRSETEFVVVQTFGKNKLKKTVTKSFTRFDF